MSIHLAEAVQRIIYPLRARTLGAAIDEAKELAPHVGLVSVNQGILITEGTPRVVDSLARAIEGTGAKLYLNTILHDTPEVMVEVAKFFAEHEAVFAWTVHASNSAESLRMANLYRGTAHVIGVVTLPHLEGPYGPRDRSTLTDAACNMAIHVGSLDCYGLVCPSYPIETLHTEGLARMNQARKRKNTRPLRIIAADPRPRWSARPDQNNEGTSPEQAILDGAHYVIWDPRHTPNAETSVLHAAELLAAEIAAAVDQLPLPHI